VSALEIDEARQPLRAPIGSEAAHPACGSAHEGAVTMAGGIQALRVCVPRKSRVKLLPD
jgi:hypothetical protein